jgi:hypothetical protein
MRRESPKTYLIVDIEVFHSHWSSIGLLVCTYPQGDILETLEVGCDDGTLVAPCKQEFWQEHAAAFLYNTALGRHHGREDQEQLVCAFLDKWFTREPSLYLLSDNPMFDIGFLQEIFLRHRPGSSIMIRDGRYYPSVCTWSMRRSVQLMTGATFTHLQSCSRPVSVWACEPARLAHTPLADCARILSEFFLLLDFIFQFRQSWRQRRYK